MKHTFGYTVTTLWIEFFRCGCNNLVSSSFNINNLEKFFCHDWPNICRSYKNLKPDNEVNEGFNDINNNNYQQDFMLDKSTLQDSRNLNSLESIYSENSELNSSSLVLILPPRLGFHQQTIRCRTQTILRIFQ